VGSCLEKSPSSCSSFEEGRGLKETQVPLIGTRGCCLRNRLVYRGERKGLGAGVCFDLRKGNNKEGSLNSNVSGGPSLPLSYGKEKGRRRKNSLRSDQTAPDSELKEPGKG